jgi:hypothetical protein
MTTSKPTTVLGLHNLLNLPVPSRWLNNPKDYQDLLELLEAPMSVNTQVDAIVMCSERTPAAQRACRQMAEGTLRWDANGQIIIDEAK